MELPERPPADSPVTSRLRARIAAAGPVPFAVVMEEALYGEGGYYAAATLPIGAGGDFVTGSSLSPLFGRATARVLSRLAGALGGPPAYLEAGYGGGEHLAAVVASLGSGWRGAVLAWDRIERPVPPGATRLGGLDALAPGALDGLIFSYELFDALPVHRLVGGSGGELRELWVDRAEPTGLRWVERELSDPGLAALLDGARLEPGQVADLAPGWRPLYRRLARSLGRGLLVTCDYGYERAPLLDPRVRRHGTLACYSRQRVHRDALGALGLEDLTAHVDWSALREAGEAEGLETVALARQARWLIAAGLFDDLDDGADSPRAEARMLLDGAGMGEEIRVLVQGRGVDASEVLDRALLGGG